MASARGGQGGTRCLSDITIARRNVFPPQSLCLLRPGSQSGMFTLLGDPNIPPQLLEMYFPEGSCMDISRDIAITLYRDLYDRICELESEGPEPQNKTKPSSKNSSDRKYRFSGEKGCRTDDVASSGTDIKVEETKLTKEGDKPSSTLRRRAVISSRSFIDAVLTGECSARNLGREDLNASQESRDNAVPEHDDGDGDVMFVNNENYAQQVDRDVHDQLSNLYAQGSSFRKSVANTSRPTYLPSTSPINEHQHSSQSILGISSTSPS
ncbi:hypothetical protein TWF970_001312 [Orbilia oligospora]|uniref:Uncharacterized protein n=1 Tax=Orbilia oligospora TaxID=2813651 RepID=A0A7C8RG93_ORBOL|nr:hypothetical protein TWF970_001312 [Orbilia oligospora]